MGRENHCSKEVWMACMRLRPMMSSPEEFLMHPWLTAQVQTLAAAPGVPMQRVQQVWAIFSPHCLAHFSSLASHPEVALHFLYWSGHFYSMHALSSGDWAKARATITSKTMMSFIFRILLQIYDKLMLINRVIMSGHL